MQSDLRRTSMLVMTCLFECSNLPSARSSPLVVARLRWVSYMQVVATLESLRASEHTVNRMSNVLFYSEGGNKAAMICVLSTMCSCKSPHPRL